MYWQSTYGRIVRMQFCSIVTATATTDHRRRIFEHDSSSDFRPILRLVVKIPAADVRKEQVTITQQLYSYLDRASLRRGSPTSVPNVCGFICKCLKIEIAFNGMVRDISRAQDGDLECVFVSLVTPRENEGTQKIIERQRFLPHI